LSRSNAWKTAKPERRQRLGTITRVILPPGFSVGPGLDFFGGEPEYFKIIPLTWQDKEFIPVLMAKPEE
jgi:hypothetical protein